MGKRLPLLTNIIASDRINSLEVAPYAIMENQK